TRTTPADVRRAVGTVRPTTRKHRHSAGKGHTLHTVLQEHLNAVQSVAHKDDRGRIRDRCSNSVRRFQVSLDLISHPSPSAFPMIFFMISVVPAKMRVT